MTQYIKIDLATRAVLGAYGQPDPPDFVGPIDEAPIVEHGAELLVWQAAPLRTLVRPSPWHRLTWAEGAAGPEWVSAAAVPDLAGMLAQALAQTYLDVDLVHRDAVGSRATEYQEAEAAARAVLAPGFEGPADDYVRGFALHNPTGQEQTDQWAAEQIVARADAFRWAQKSMRTLRFQRQAEMRAAVTAEELHSVVALWSGFIATLRAQLGLPPT